MADEFNLYGYNAISLVGENDLGERIKSFNNLQDDKNPLEIICAVDMYNSSLLREVSNSWDEEYEKLLLAEKMLNCTNFDIIHNNLDDVTSKKPVFIEIRNQKIF